jgi:hypothetical protein
MKVQGKMLDPGCHSLSLGSFGSFGKGAWDVINLACDPGTHLGAGGDYVPRALPDPEQDFVVFPLTWLRSSGAETAATWNLLRSSGTRSTRALGLSGSGERIVCDTARGVKSRALRGRGRGRVMSLLVSGENLSQFMQPVDRYRV